MIEPNVGDKVFIKVDLKKNLAPNRVCTQAMHKIIRDGKVKTIGYVGNDYVCLKEDNEKWFWDIGWIVPVDDGFEGNI